MPTMRPKTTARDLPPRMVTVKRTMKSGKLWIGYYYNGRDESGRRVKLPLGTDLNEAKTKWAELEAKRGKPVDPKTVAAVFKRYVKEVLGTKSPRTQKDYLSAIEVLTKVFGAVAIDAIRPVHVRQYLDKRSAKVRGNREIAVLSTVLSHARAWGMTDKPNACMGVSRNKETPRTFYADDEVWGVVYAAACSELQDAMDLAYLTGQRPADVRKMRWSDIKGGALEVRQGKTDKMLRILVEHEGQRTGLGLLIDRLRERKVAGMTLVSTASGARLTEAALRHRWGMARDAATKARPEMAERIRQFQFRDIRPKAASETDLDHASRLLGHTKQQITRTVYRRVGETVLPTK